MDVMNEIQPTASLTAAASASFIAGIVSTAASVYPLAGVLLAGATVLAFLAVRAADVARTQHAEITRNAEIIAEVRTLAALIAEQNRRFDVFTTNFTASQALGRTPQRGADGHYISPLAAAAARRG